MKNQLIFSNCIMNVIWISFRSARLSFFSPTPRTFGSEIPPWNLLFLRIKNFRLPRRLLPPEREKFYQFVFTAFQRLFIKMMKPMKTRKFTFLALTLLFFFAFLCAAAKCSECFPCCIKLSSLYDSKLWKNVEGEEKKREGKGHVRRNEKVAAMKKKENFHNFIFFSHQIFFPSWSFNPLSLFQHWIFLSARSAISKSPG